MLTSKFNLYNTEWTDRVFDDRNKAYGAYELRHNYANTMVKAMAITFLGVGVLFGSTLIFKANTSVATLPKKDTIAVVLQQFVKPDEPLPKPKVIEPAKPVEPVATTKFVPMVVKPDPKTLNPPKVTEFKGAIGPETIKGDPKLTSVPIVEVPKGPPGGVLSANNAPVTDFSSLEVMPEPVGGAAAWNKFLSKNLRFPPVAQEEGVGGRVFLSFIIEKDGTLSHITVDQPAGHGFDEEALRVLKLAKAWTPGRQNGQPVRVKYSIPINFQAPEI